MLFSWQASAASSTISSTGVADVAGASLTRYVRAVRAVSLLALAALASLRLDFKPAWLFRDMLDAMWKHQMHNSTRLIDLDAQGLWHTETHTH